MSISYNDSGDLRTIAVSGRLDVEGTDSVADKLAELVKAARKGVVVDLSALKFLASIGIRTLILAAKELKARGGRMEGVWCVVVWRMACIRCKWCRLSESNRRPTDYKSAGLAIATNSLRRRILRGLAR